MLRFCDCLCMIFFFLSIILVLLWIFNHDVFLIQSYKLNSATQYNFVICVNFLLFRWIINQ
jgi:hypothetical protein